MCAPTPSDNAGRDTDAMLRLALCGGAAAPRRALLLAFGSAAGALEAGPARWRECGLDRLQIHALHHDDALPALARSRDWLSAPGHRLIGWHDPDYPALLRRIASPPLALFVAGEVGRLWHPGVAVVGSRNPSAGGRDNAHRFALEIARSGLSVISGLAAGVDRAAHEAALEAGGVTVAVLGTGPDVPYPKTHAPLLAKIAAQGVVVSEHPPGTEALREHFPSRNRIIAGLALGTLVVEAAHRSGALITARLAAEAGREVFAIPGSIHNPMARGCHRLIRDGAALIESAEEAIAALGPWAATLGEHLRRHPAGPISAASLPADPGDPAKDRDAARLPASFPDDPAYHRLWQALGHDPTDMDRLAERTGLTPATLSSMLLVMELQGRVVADHGRYCRRSG
ncbi:MAG: DNA-processing protein DprA [Xanthomonadaceae bacterium]|nr:DNA-processing protein DprA [Xanthomonadaceae bacterium]